jgi:hypothetical protein
MSLTQTTTHLYGFYPVKHRGTATTTAVYDPRRFCSHSFPPFLRFIALTGKSFILFIFIALLISERDFR